MKHLKKFNENHDQFVHLSVIEDVLIEALKKGEIDMTSINVDQLIQRMRSGFYPSPSRYEENNEGLKSWVQV